MPFAGRIGSVATVLQQAGYSDNTLIQNTQVTRSAHMRLWNGFAHVAYAIQVIVYACEQHRSRRCARSADMKI